jgi:hypothetical protein
MKFIIFVFAFVLFVAVNAKHTDLNRKNVKNKGCPTMAPPPPPTCSCLVQGDGCDFTDVIKFFKYLKFHVLIILNVDPYIFVIF